MSVLGVAVDDARLPIQSQVASVGNSAGEIAICQILENILNGRVDGAAGERVVGVRKESCTVANIELDRGVFRRGGRDRAAFSGGVGSCVHRGRVLGEVSLHLSDIGHRRYVLRRSPIAIASITAEEEVLVVTNRAAECAAEAVLDIRGFGCLVEGGRVEIPAAIELEGGTMPLVGSGLCHYAHDSSGVAPKLRAEVVGLHIVLAGGIRVRGGVAAVAQARHVEAAVEIVGNLARKIVCRTVDVDVRFIEAEAVCV